MAVFPHIGHIGYPAKDAYRQLVREYDDGGYRRYRRSSFNHREVVLKFTRVSKTMKDDVVAFFRARVSSATDFEFTFYHPEETNTVDPTGASPTGRHTARFGDDELEVTRSGRCTWSFDVRVVLLN